MIASLKVYIRALYQPSRNSNNRIINPFYYPIRLLFTFDMSRINSIKPSTRNITVEEAALQADDLRIQCSTFNNFWDSGVARTGFYVNDYAYSEMGPFTSVNVDGTSLPVSRAIKGVFCIHNQNDFMHPISTRKKKEIYAKFMSFQMPHLLATMAVLESVLVVPSTSRYRLNQSEHHKLEYNLFELSINQEIANAYRYLMLKQLHQLNLAMICNRKECSKRHNAAGPQYSYPGEWLINDRLSILREAMETRDLARISEKRQLDGIDIINNISRAPIPDESSVFATEYMEAQQKKKEKRDRKTPRQTIKARKERAAAAEKLLSEQEARKSYLRDDRSLSISEPDKVGATIEDLAEPEAEVRPVTNPTVPAVPRRPRVSAQQNSSIRAAIERGFDYIFDDDQDEPNFVNLQTGQIVEESESRNQSLSMSELLAEEHQTGPVLSNSGNSDSRFEPYPTTASERYKLQERHRQQRQR